ncbi:NAD(P)H-binding protein, partial [Natrialba asiatica]
MADTTDSNTTVLVAGSHGQVGQHVTTELVASDHAVRAMVRADDQVEEMEA